MTVMPYGDHHTAEFTDTVCLCIDEGEIELPATFSAFQGCVYLETVQLGGLTLTSQQFKQAVGAVEYARQVGIVEQVYGERVK